jgi:hypothetical protein
MNTDRNERLVMAKELTEYFAAQGVTISYAYARAVIEACPQSIRHRYVRPSDAWTFWVLNPGFRPFGCPPGSDGLAEMAENH